MVFGDSAEHRLGVLIVWLTFLEVEECFGVSSFLLIVVDGESWVIAGVHV
jgi:hypothetical protein